MPKIKLKLVDRKIIGDNIYLVTFHSEDELLFVPGQFISFKVAPSAYRSYSILDLSFTPSSYKNVDNLTNGIFLSFIVNAKQHGVGVDFMINTVINTFVEGVGPAGKFKLQDTKLNKIFVCTGTGLAPFVPMIKTLLSDRQNIAYSIQLYFGIKTNKDNFINLFFSDQELAKIKVITCLTDEEPLEGQYTGFVNNLMESKITEYNNSEFYICGNPLMVQAVENLLISKQVDKIYKEKFSL